MKDRNIKRMTLAERIELLIGSVLISLGVFFPLWGMTLTAPQYPEGLRVSISASTITGDMDIINTLNHYVGMRDLDAMSFPELQYMKWVILGLAILFLISAIIGRLWTVEMVLAASAAIGVVGFYDLYSKLYQYGHNLDPHAPIKLSGGFTPPVLGENQLANFHTNSYFMTGSYLVVVSALIGVLVLWQEIKRQRFSA